ncbi:hypothetical protein V6N11_021734 [Hibiscus sabdariffa]|uniref:Uncharacterized protein n=1 Tax=Hibiscus sabdariffa TaxID=183260 RepID=A0ABR2TH53_9ROSI
MRSLKIIVELRVENMLLLLVSMDEHGGPDASRFISDHLFQNLIRLTRASGLISEDILGSSFSTTEDGFLTLVLVWVDQIRLLHNASKDEVKQEVRLLHPGDSHIVGAWHIKGIIQQAVKIVSNSPRAGIARRLIRTTFDYAN